MKPYYQDEWVTQYCDDALKILPELPSDSVDLLTTDPPYGIGFMGKDWDRALPDKRIWAECFRVLKAGSFAFVMSIPRADCLSRMIISLEDARFWVNFTPIFWIYASGFPKAQNISKAVDKKLGAESEIVGKNPNDRKQRINPLSDYGLQGGVGGGYITTPATTQAKALDGSYGGFQPKPAVEVIIVAMKPLSEKTFVDQALKNGKGITWLDGGRIPYQPTEEELDIGGNFSKAGKSYEGKMYEGSYFESKTEQTHAIPHNAGRFPANLLVSDDVLNDGEMTKSGRDAVRRQEGMFIEHKLGGLGRPQVYHPDSGSFSRYFDLDAWWAERIKQLPESVQRTFPFLIVPKASKSEKGKDCIHPTVKPLKLICYLITLGSRAGDTVVDPFSGSGTTPVACQLLNRYCTAIEIKEKYCEIATNRCRQIVMELRV